MYQGLAALSTNLYLGLLEALSKNREEKGD